MSRIVDTISNLVLITFCRECDNRKSFKWDGKQFACTQCDITIIDVEKQEQEEER